MRNRIAQNLAIAFGVLAAYTLPSHAAGTLTGREVLDLDGAIARRSLQAEAGVSQQQSQPQAAPQAAVVGQPEPARQYAPARTTNVLGIDATAVGGPVSFVAYLRWNDHEFPVRVGTVLNGYRVTHIDPASGTDLMSISGQRHLHLPRETLTDALAISSPERKLVQVPTQPAAMPASTNPVQPPPAVESARTAINAPAGSPAQGPANTVPLSPSVIVRRTGPVVPLDTANPPSLAPQQSGGQ